MTAAALPNVPSWKLQSRMLRTITGNIAMPGFTAPKLVWVQEA